MNSDWWPVNDRGTVELDCWDFCDRCPPAREPAGRDAGSAVVSEGGWAKAVARHAWSPRAQTARVRALFDAAIAAGRHTWPALAFPQDTVQATALMRMLLAFDQRGRCAGCGRRTDWLLLDHCHVTHLVRGALCHRCNTLEAHGPVEYLQAYRRRPPAFWLGWVVPHVADHPAPNVAAVTAAVLQALRAGTAEHYIAAAWGDAWLQARLRANSPAPAMGESAASWDDPYEDAR